MKRFSEKYIITKKMEWEVLGGSKGSEIELFWGGFKALHLLVFYTPHQSILHNRHKPCIIYQS